MLRDAWWMKPALNPSAKLTRTSFCQVNVWNFSTIPAAWKWSFPKRSWPGRLAQCSVDSELLTTQQLSDEQILSIVAGHSNERESSDKEDDGQKQQNASKSTFPGWRDKMTLTWFKLSSFVEWWTAISDHATNLQNKLACWIILVF